jgi:hypothetical protein
MGRKLSDDLHEGDPVAVALRGGAGWVTGTVVWIHESQMLVRHDDSSLDAKTPFVLIDLSEITGLGLPREIEPETRSTFATGFGRD